MRYAGDTCQACPVKAKCITAGRGGRQLTLRPQPVQQALDTARAEQSTNDWQHRYARQAGVQYTTAQATKVRGVKDRAAPSPGGSRRSSELTVYVCR